MRSLEVRAGDTDGQSASEQLLRPLGRATLPQEIVAAIAELIMRRVWRPGDRIPPEKELAARFNVGRSTIREAIKSLVIVGVIDSRPGDGSFIRESQSALLSGAFQWGMLLTERNLSDLVDMRVLIEGECAARAATFGSPDMAPRLVRMVERMQGERYRPQEFMQLDNEFHAEIATAARNALYLSVSNTIQSLVSVWYIGTFRLEPTKAATIAEHSAIASAIQAGDALGAREAMRRHVVLAAQRLQKVLNEENVDQAAPARRGKARRGRVGRGGPADTCA
ncbi:MAG TPA: FadR/GntR family transcriptional regulator [Acetobacteraceae bacterium]|nr:FadR/GntR family transcriptional regulator [Acetobacteraceae bacterium]